MRTLATLLALTAATLAIVSPSSAAPVSSTSTGPGSPYTVLQMNLCLSGGADCYARTAYPAIVDEAADQIVGQGVSAVTLDEACSGDAADLARRTGYQMRFAAVLFQGAPLQCVRPGRRGVFGIAVLTEDAVETSDHQAFATHAGVEERRWICVTTTHAVTVCAAHLGTRGSRDERRANDAECAELRGVLAGYDRAGTTVFGGDLNRHRSCAPSGMWAREDLAAGQLPGIQHIYASTSLDSPSARVTAATHTDHDFLSAGGWLPRGPAPARAGRSTSTGPVTR